jgi:two-component sensor histidine kinase
MQNLELRAAADAAVKKYSSELAQREQREARIRVLMRELAHRSKNLLAVVEAIARQTADSTVAIPQYVGRLSQRIHALADTHELMAAEDWFGISLHQLLKRQLRPFAEGNARVTFEGPSLSVNGRAAQNIGLAMHELAANAIMYGALSVPDGSIAITWHLEGHDPSSSRLQLRWAEQGGPPMARDRPPGFGSRVLAHLTPAALQGSAGYTLSDHGIDWLLDVPATSVVE